MMMMLMMIYWLKSYIELETGIIYKRQIKFNFKDENKIIDLSGSW